MTSTEAVLGGPSAGEAHTGLLPQLVLALLCGGYTTGAVLGWGADDVADFMGDFGLSAAAAAAAVSMLLYARRAAAGHRAAWLLFAASSTMVALGNGIWGWYEVVLHRPVPQTSPADFCFLLFAPPAVIGLLVLAKRPVTRAGWVCLGLDTWLIGGSLLTLSWSLALARTARFDGPSTARVAMSLAYPLLDIVLVSMVLALHFRRSPANRSAVNTALAALALTVLCDALFTSPLLREHYRSGQILDAGWFAGSMLMAYAPWVGRREQPLLRPGTTTRRVTGSLSALTPYLAAAVCTLGILYDVITGGKCDKVVLLTGSTVVLALVVRQGIMLLDNIALTQELAQKENHFRSLVQGSSDVIMIAAPTGVLRYVSPASVGVYGRDPEELVGTELSAHIHPDDLGRVVHEVRRFLAAPPGDEPATRIECRIRSGRRGGPHGEDGEDGWLNVESSVNRYQGGLIFNSRDVTERVRLQAQLQHNASHDPLTDLPNRLLFLDRVGRALGGRRAGDGRAAVLYVDLDGFKAVNDSNGHQAGDHLLTQAARRLQDALRAGDTAARLGGDEFAVLVCGALEHQVREIAERLRAALCEPYRVDGGEVRVGASIGVAFAEPGSAAGELMRNADLAMYRAKQAGKGRVELYAPQLQADVVRRTELATRLHQALHDGEFTLLHQPVVELSGGRIAGVEAQARWRSAQGILFTPAEFLRAAEDVERTSDLGRWQLEQAVAQAALRYGAGHRVPVTVKLSAHRLLHRDLPAGAVEGLLERHELPPGALVVELTGGDPRIALDELERRLTELRKVGVRISLGGFGSGHAALSALRSLPVDAVKLDRGFVEGVVESGRLHKITRGLLRIAADLGVRTVADGVDRPEQVHALRELGCGEGQGMAFSGLLDEHRLRGSLTRGGYPVPGDSGRSEPPSGGRSVPQETAREQVGSRTVQLPSCRSHNETRVPPA
ncbi:EAL domain-containing protein [Streptomyces cocklensis]|uniref:PAS domain S-box-containing protein/diguanylate cyclase (GGDEF) domain-containing protein n=1 Tax=Actinacidiphila cocklensis TaxID=887465 RepID=A0A9W4DKC3_9ACTN|nr:EAL domain-containing protein [Actinacidiphila cocklensis]MDD1060163.1 EAL domain-containing protein [Actinacidiphila cocklensis]WSX76598.1 EAL domain-containing protein [Streptomyces sp. NBC_00899]CAG6391747.1 PAS domain S-box-containing protein/diguanylate cyclase (GGDEF) domain-containing protein [Actinacidiphila cocklensis]